MLAHEIGKLEIWVLEILLPTSIVLLNFILACINCLCCKCGEEARIGDKRPTSIPGKQLAVGRPILLVQSSHLNMSVFR